MSTYSTGCEHNARCFTGWEAYSTFTPPLLHFYSTFTPLETPGSRGVSRGGGPRHPIPCRVTPLFRQNRHPEVYITKYSCRHHSSTGRLRGWKSIEVPVRILRPVMPVWVCVFPLGFYVVPPLGFYVAQSPFLSLGFGCMGYLAGQPNIEPCLG